MAHARAIYSMFDFYASLGAAGYFSTIGFNGYKQFVADNGLALDRSKHCDASHLFTFVSPSITSPRWANTMWTNEHTAAMPNPFELRYLAALSPSAL